MLKAFLWILASLAINHIGAKLYDDGRGPAIFSFIAVLGFIGVIVATVWLAMEAWGIMIG